MQVARVIGTVTSSFKHDSLVGAKLLLVQPLLADGEGFDGDPQVRGSQAASCSAASC